MNEPINSTAEAVRPIEEIHRLMKELSERLAEHNGGRWFAMTMPAGQPYPQRLGVWPAGTRTMDELPIDKLTRIAWELSGALDDYQHGQFMAMVLPASRGGFTVMLQKVEGMRS